MKKVLNLTQHAATPEQVEAGVIEPTILPLEAGLSLQEVKRNICAHLTFEKIPTSEILAEKAKTLAMVAKWHGVKYAMIGGAPFFMATLEKALAQNGIQPVYAFSQRESVETIKEDGSVVKSAVFRHVGFVEADV